MTLHIGKPYLNFNTCFCGSKKNKKQKTPRSLVRACILGVFKCVLLYTSICYTLSAKKIHIYRISSNLLNTSNHRGHFLEQFS